MRKSCYHCRYSVVHDKEHPCDNCTECNNWLPTTINGMVERYKNMHRRAQSAESEAIQNAKLAKKYRAERANYRANRKSFEDMLAQIVKTNNLDKLSIETLFTIKSYLLEKGSSWLFRDCVEVVIEEIDKRMGDIRGVRGIGLKYSWFTRIIDAWKELNK